MLGDHLRVAGMRSAADPRRTASCTVAIKPADALSLAITTTRSRAPTQPGRPWVGHATNGTGQFRFQHRPDKARLRPGGDHCPGPWQPFQQGFRLYRIGGFASYAGSGLQPGAAGSSPPRRAPADRPARRR